jgi:hypothetical protein
MLARHNALMPAEGQRRKSLCRKAAALPAAMV